MDFRPNVRKLAIALLCGFLVLLAPLTYWQVLVATRLQASPYNERAKARRKAIRRGSIFDRNGGVLAETQPFGSDLEERVYPLDEAAAHVVGYYARVHGRDGIERTQDDALMALGPYLTSPKRLFSPRRVGCDVTLTLDADAQQAAHVELGRRRGAVVAVDPRTGEILVMVSAPSFHPALVDEEWPRIRQRGDAPLLNRATARPYRPGAALQLIIATAAIDLGAARASDTFTCRGSADVGGMPVDCSPRRGHGQISLTGAFAQSCRIALATLATRLGPERLDEYIRRFGWRGAPELEIPVRRSAVRELTALSPADFVATCLDGHGVRLTPLAMCSAAASIANGGVRMQPYLVRSVADVNGRMLNQTPRRRLGRVCSSWAAAELGALMTSAVRRGTARRAGIPDVEVAGIAGSAEEPDVGANSWFLGFAPADSPEVAVAVVIEDGGGSGEQAAKLAGGVFEAMLR